jgi:hypothetical protein
MNQFSDPNERFRAETNGYGVQTGYIVDRFRDENDIEHTRYACPDSWVQDLVELGVGTVRIPVEHPISDPAFNQGLIPFIQGCIRNRITPIILLTGEISNYENEQNLDRYVADAIEIARRLYREASVRYFEIWNEPNSAAHLPGDGFDAEVWAETHDRVSSVLLDQNGPTPDVGIVTAGLFWAPSLLAPVVPMNEMDTFLQWFADRGRHPWHFIGVHMYCGDLPLLRTDESNRQSVRAVLRAIGNLSEAKGLPPRPLLVTETGTRRYDPSERFSGCTAGVPGPGEAEQAMWLDAWYDMYAAFQHDHPGVLDATFWHTHPINLDRLNLGIVGWAWGLRTGEEELADSERWASWYHLQARIQGGQPPACQRLT